MWDARIARLAVARGEESKDTVRGAVRAVAEPAVSLSHGINR